MTMASDPEGSIDPVKIRAQWPRSTGRDGALPAGISPTKTNSTGDETEACATSSE
jgi:hypothetical protein